MNAPGLECFVDTATAVRRVVAVAALRPLRRPAKRRGGGVTLVTQRYNQHPSCPLCGQTESQRDSVHHPAACRSIPSFLQSTWTSALLAKTFGRSLAGLLIALIFSGCTSREITANAATAHGCEIRQGGIIRGPVDRKRIALVFTGHEYAEGTETILDELAKHHAHGSFFLTGAFLTNEQFRPLVERMKSEGHYLGPHSDAHLLFCDWSPARKTLIPRAQFSADLRANAAKLPEPFCHAGHPRFLLPAFENYNTEIANWSAAEGFTLVNFTPGTRSNADYTDEADANFVSSKSIYDSILKREHDNPHGLNGFILLFHTGSGPGRQDKFSARFGALLDELSARGYEFVRIDKLLLPGRK